VTNLLIIFGFRATRPQPVEDPLTVNDSITETLKSQATVVIGLGAVYAAAIYTIACHPDPVNSLSIPTWVVHSSSLLEWLYAMKLAWEHADFSKNPKWRSLTWAMIPSHTSGICACTYHIFYNSPLLSWIVSLQAGLTVTGNIALMAAAYQIYSYGKEYETQSSESTTLQSIESAALQSKESAALQNIESIALQSTESAALQSTQSTALLPITEERSDLQYFGFKPLEETDSKFWKEMLFKSVVIAFAVKYVTTIML
jgi:hypothetical protein